MARERGDLISSGMILFSVVGGIRLERNEFLTIKINLFSMGIALSLGNPSQITKLSG